ncbi:MAG: phage holin family protein [Salibacteraceae bacterium]
MNLLVKILISALAVMVSQYILPGVNVDTFFTGIMVALLLGLFNATIKPVLVILTLPITVITLGFFLLVINVFIIELAAGFLDGFTVDGFWWAVIFSFVLSFVTSVFNGFDEKEELK